MYICVSKNNETTAYFVNALKIGTFQNSNQFSKGGPLEKSYFFIFSKLFYFTLEYHMGLSQCNVRNLECWNKPCWPDVTQSWWCSNTCAQSRHHTAPPPAIHGFVTIIYLFIIIYSIESLHLDRCFKTKRWFGFMHSSIQCSCSSIQVFAV